MRKKSIIAGTALTLVLVASIASAQGRTGANGWYGGIDLGRSRIGLTGSDVDSALARQGIGAAGVNERDDTAWGFNLGYQVNRHLAIEGGYADLGKFSYNATANTPGPDIIDGSYRSEALSVSAVGILPLQSNWSLYGKAGVARTSTKLTVASTTGATSPASVSESGSGLLIGAGLKYDINRNVFAKAGWDRYARVGSEATGKADIDVYTLGVGYRY